MNLSTPKWSDYKVEFRHAPWKLLLPVSIEDPILVVGIGRVFLSSISRTFKNIHVIDCQQQDINWAIEQGRSLGHQYRFKNIGKKGSPFLAGAQSVNVQWQSKPPKPSWNWWDPQANELVTQWRTTPFMNDWNKDGLNDLVMLLWAIPSMKTCLTVSCSKKRSRR